MIISVNTKGFYWNYHQY